jgi:hypothetical protein
MRAARTLALVTAAGFSAAAACDHRRAYQPPAGSFTVATLDVADSGDTRPPQRMRVAAVTPAFFAAADSLAVRPLLGRRFQPGDYRPGDDRPGAARVLLLSHRLWQQRYGARPQVIGTWVRVDGRPTVVVGVMPPDFDAPPGTDAWIPTAGAGADTAAAPARGPN